MEADAMSATISGDSTSTGKSFSKVHAKPYTTPDWARVSSTPIPTTSQQEQEVESFLGNLPMRKYVPPLSRFSSVQAELERRHKLQAHSSIWSGLKTVLSGSVPSFKSPVTWDGDTLVGTGSKLPRSKLPPTPEDTPNQSISSSRYQSRFNTASEYAWEGEPAE